MKNLNGLDLLSYHFSVMKSLVVDGIIAELSLVPRIHMVVVRADPPSCPLTCVLSNNSQKSEKETFTVSSVFGFTLVQFTLLKKKVFLVMSLPLLPHLLPSQEGSLFKFSSGNIADLLSQQ